ncbi:MAG: phage tail tape measure protein, partial [Ignisphaera sp.]|nr:phage tail tape measure protein [Ignisphaera sp.]
MAGKNDIEVNIGVNLDEKSTKDINDTIVEKASAAGKKAGKKAGESFKSAYQEEMVTFKPITTEQAETMYGKANISRIKKESEEKLALEKEYNIAWTQAHQQQAKLINTIDLKALSDKQSYEKTKIALQKRTIEENQRLEDTFYKKNLSSYDSFIKGKEDASKRFSSGLKSQMEERYKLQEKEAKSVQEYAKMQYSSTKSKQGRDSFIGNPDVIQAEIDKTAKYYKKALNDGVAWTADSSKSGNAIWAISELNKRDELAKTTKQMELEAERAKKLTASGAWNYGTTIGHKVVTTASYMAVGAAIYGVVGALGSMKDAIVQADKAERMFQGVLGMTVEDSKKLENSVFKTAIATGTQTETLNEATLALGRAGIANKDLAESMDVVAKASNVSGDSMADITEMMAYWKKLYPDKPIRAIADSMVAVANSTTASIAGMKTMTTYLLTVGKQSGLTAEGLIALTGAWKDLGKSDSTVGTEIRRLFIQIASGSKDVKKAYENMGIDIPELKKNLDKGGDVAENAMKKFFVDLNKATKNGSVGYIDSVKGVLNQSTMRSASELGAMTDVFIEKDGGKIKLALNKHGKIMSEAEAADRNRAKIAGESVEQVYKVQVTAYEKQLMVSKQAKDALDMANLTIALSYSNLYKSLVAIVDKGAVQLEEGFVKGFAGSGATTGDLKKQMEEFEISYSKVMVNIGEIAGNIFSVLVQVSDEAVIAIKAALVGLTAVGTYLAAGAIINGILLARDAFILFQFTVAIEGGGALAVFTTAAGIATAGLEALKLALLNNPLTVVFAVATAAAAGMIAYADSLAKADSIAANSNGLKNIKADLDAINSVVGKDAQLALVSYFETLLVQSINAKVAFYNANKGWFEATQNNEVRTARVQIATQKQELEELKKQRERIVGSPDAPTRPPKIDPPSNDKTKKVRDNSKDLYAEEIARLKLREQDYFYNNKITSELDQQAYHIKTTIPDMLIAANLLSDKEKRSKALFDIERDGIETARKSLDYIEAQNIALGKQLSATALSARSIGYISEEFKIQLELENEQLSIKEKLADQVKAYGEEGKKVGLTAKAELAANNANLVATNKALEAKRVLSVISLN